MKNLEINPECDQILYKSATQPTYLGYKRVVILTYVQLPLDWTLFQTLAFGLLGGSRVSQRYSLGVKQGVQEQCELSAPLLKLGYEDLLSSLSYM